MKTCATCNRLYPIDAGFCPVDGKPLVLVTDAQIPSEAGDPRVGQTFCKGRYQIRRKVADGGMGRVYQALDNQKQMSVALKILHADVATDPVAVQRFKREFEVSAGLPHDHIVHVLDFEQTEDHSYALVMEYLEGEELRLLLKRDKTMVPERVIRMLAHVAIGLGAAHERKVVHRDLKPDNIFLCGTHDGDIAKILDFGSVRDNSDGAKKLTVMGTTIGSPFYMAPEQAQGLASLDHRADVWSLAAIAYECLTGVVPFAGPTGPAILLAILTKEPTAPSEAGRAQGVPVTLDEVFEEALTKNPDIRVKTIGELADKFGAAYGLDGTHVDWAITPQADLSARIAIGLPLALERRANKASAGPNVAAMDDAFKAGSAGGPVVPSPFDDDQFAMGVPQARPKWVVPAVAGAAVVLGVLLTFVLLEVVR